MKQIAHAHTKSNGKKSNGKVSHAKTNGAAPQPVNVERLIAERTTDLTALARRMSAAELRDLSAEIASARREADKREEEERATQLVSFRRAELESLESELLTAFAV